MLARDQRETDSNVAEQVDDLRERMRLLQGGLKRLSCVNAA